ncbi:MAG: hypothetical protein E7208_10350 [Clostridium butyricum]|nr:hypothetical protein [Clostridium butyricum]
MNTVLKNIENKMKKNKLSFIEKPLVIGGMAMEYYGMRKAGADIDLIISDKDYEILAKMYPDKRKDLFGDLGVIIDEFEIWRSIALLDYNFYKHDAIEEGDLLMVSIDRLLLMRVFAMDVEKYRKDLNLVKNYYYTTFTNPQFSKEAEIHKHSYEKNNGVIFSGKYEDR